MTPIRWEAAVDIGHGRGRLAPHAAASLRRVDAALGRPLDVNEAWRSPEQADANYAAYQRYLNGGPWAPIALPSWASVHCAGEAVDTDDGYNSWAIGILNDHGWFTTVYRWVNGVWTLVEPWHFEYFIDRDNHRYSGAPAGGEEDMPSYTDSDRARDNRTHQDVKTIKRLLIDQVINVGTGQFFKHGDMPKGSNLWIWVMENGDFVRIRDLATAQQYKQLNGGQNARLVSGAAIRELVAKLVIAGGRDLSAIDGQEVPTPVSEQDVPDEGASPTS